MPDGAGFQALIFDWDGTLMDSREVCDTALAHASADGGVTPAPGLVLARRRSRLPIRWCCRSSSSARCPHRSTRSSPLPDERHRHRRAARRHRHVRTDRPSRARRGQRTAIGSTPPPTQLRPVSPRPARTVCSRPSSRGNDVPAGQRKTSPGHLLLTARRLQTRRTAA